MSVAAPISRAEAVIGIAVISTAMQIILPAPRI